MRSAVALSLVALFVAAACAQQQLGLPELHVIQKKHFEKPYSKGGDGSYNSSALFLSDYAQQRNLFDMLYNGVSTEESLSIQTDGMGVVADLGAVPLAKVSAAVAFNVERTVGFETTWKQSMPAVEGHTYAVLLSHGGIEGMFAFSIVSIEPGSLAMDIEWAAQRYRVTQVVAESPGFGWEKGNHK